MGEKLSGWEVALSLAGGYGFWWLLSWGGKGDIFILFSLVVLAFIRLAVSIWRLP